MCLLKLKIYRVDINFTICQVQTNSEVLRRNADPTTEQNITWKVSHNGFAGQISIIHHLHNVFLEPENQSGRNDITLPVIYMEEQFISPRHIYSQCGTASSRLHRLINKCMKTSEFGIWRSLWRIIVNEVKSSFLIRFFRSSVSVTNTPCQHTRLPIFYGFSLIQCIPRVRHTPMYNIRTDLSCLTSTFYL